MAIMVKLTYSMSTTRYEAGLNQAIADDQKFVSEHYSVLEGPILTHVWHASEMFLLLMELN